MPGTFYVNGRFLSQPITGVQRYARELSSRLSQLSDRSVVLVPSTVPPEAIPDGMTAERVGRLGGHTWEQLELPRWLNKRESPLLLNLTNTGPVGYRNQIVTHHDVTYIRYPRTYSPAFRLAYRMLAAHTLPTAKLVVTVSEFSRAEIATCYGLNPDQVQIVTNAAAEIFADKVWRGLSGAYYLAVGSLLPHKNIEGLLRAFGAYRDRGGNAELLVVGTAPSFSGQALQMPQASGIRMLGRVSDDQLAELYTGARGFIFPSKYEGFGIPPIEAQSVGCPVIASDIPALRETLRDSAEFFRPDDWNDLAHTLSSLDAHVPRREDLHQKGILNSRRFSWDAEARRLLGLIEAAELAARIP